jgi:membrane protein implicated in regulation of membrane protease activity
VAAAFEPWVWLAAGVLFCAAEVFAPGMFLLWLGLAALATGLLQFGLALGFAGSLLAFCGFALASVLIGRRVYGSRDVPSDRPFLNRRADALVGQEFLLHDPIVEGMGRVRVGDSVWRVLGPDLPAGTRVRIVSIAEDGVALRAEAVGRTPA